ncbi:putative Rho GTPase activation protein [Helianthus anomalus]
MQAEGIVRINADNNQEEHLRNQLNNCVVPDGIDIHCLAGHDYCCIVELPEEDCTALCHLLPPTETALLDWAINLMAGVVQHEHLNKMNSQNISMVFSPNVSQMADPLNALMYAVQVINFLKTLILKALRE